MKLASFVFIKNKIQYDVQTTIYGGLRPEDMQPRATFGSHVIPLPNNELALGYIQSKRIFTINIFSQFLL